MKIAINCWILRNKNLYGIGYFTVNTISRVIRDHPEVQFQILCDKKFTEDHFDFPNVTKHRIFPALRHPVLYVFFMELVLPFFLRKHRPDLLVSTDGFLSLLSGCKQVPIIYDINFEHRPEDLKLKNRLYYRFFFKRFAHKAKRIMTISEFSKTDISDFYKIDPAKIDNISCGISSGFETLSQETIETVRNKWSGGKPYFFFIGSMHPRKNINRLIEAYGFFRQESGSDVKLLLAGSILWAKSDIEETYNNSLYKSDIIFTGRLTDSELHDVLGAAFALSFVPLFEGFGLPIVEAMQSGVPVICSNVTSMPEAGGDAVLYVDPYKVTSITDAMIKLWKDEGLRKELIVKGNQQKNNFSWDKTATLFWKSIEKVI